MKAFDSGNHYFKMAVAFVTQTNRHLFITGKAGTGKTTFLRFIKEQSQKKMAIVAPTGVAAINAGGVTIHSFFQLPTGPFIPSTKHNWQAIERGANNPVSLVKNLRIPSEKREVMKELELLVIDEVSMVRADLLDAIDHVLRHVRRLPYLPFGGVQVVYIGDLFQLPPVVRNDEWELLNEYYKSPFFFDSIALQSVPPVKIELKKIYRQKDDMFINILNNVRNNTCTASDLQHLSSYYNPAFTPNKDDGFITLTSHNAQADQINQRELAKLKEQPIILEATVTGEFYERAYPADKVLTLKVGAQVMFIKNDKGENRRYYNGKIGTITGIKDEKIIVQCKGDLDELEIEREKWQNIKYQYNEQEDKLDEEEIGSFSQYPVRLAWAITIHKSQGLTFDKAIIDAGSSFAPGQVYVALSRLTSLNGLVLYSKIHAGCISTDERVVQYVQDEFDTDEMQLLLADEQKLFVRSKLLQGFDWSKISETAENHVTLYNTLQLTDKTTYEAWAQEMAVQVKKQQEVADKFIKKLEWLFTTCEVEGYEQLFERVNAAAAYFVNELDTHLLHPCKSHIQKVKVKQRVKKYLKALQSLQVVFEQKKLQLEQAVSLAGAMLKKSDMLEVMEMMHEHKEKAKAKVEVSATTKKEKGESGRITLELFKKGISIADIAIERNLAPSTVSSHLAAFVTTGDVDILDLVEADKLDKILEIIAKTPNATASEQKALLGDDFTYGEIKAAYNYHLLQKQLQA